MTRFLTRSIGICGVVLMLGGGASAQIVAPAIPPLVQAPPSPPPPAIYVPQIPQLDDPPATPRAALRRRGSFSDRVVNCLEQGAAAGLSANRRAAYSRMCANQ
jgi:hypothetical protein